MLDKVCIRIDSVDADGNVVFSAYEQLPNSLRISATDKAGGTSETVVDLSCLSSNISLDARCDEIVTPSVREPFSYWLDLTISEGGIDIAQARTQDTGDSVTTTISASIDALLSFSLSARSSIGADGTNSYVLGGVSLASIIAAGSDGVRFPLTNCQGTFSGVDCSLPVWMSCVDNGSNSYTFNFMTGTEASSSTDFVLDLVSGSTRVDLKPLLEHIGGHIENCVVGDVSILPALVSEPDTMPSGRFFYVPYMAFYATVQDVCDDDNPITVTSTTENDDGSFTVCLDSEPSYVYLEGMTATADGPDDEGHYASEMDWGSCTDINCSIDAMIAAGEAGVTIRQFDNDTEEPTGKTLQLRCVYNGAVTPETEHGALRDEPVQYCYTFYVLDVATKPMLKLGPSCEPCIDLSPLTGSLLKSISGEMVCDATRYVAPSNLSPHTYVFCYDDQGSLGDASNITNTDGVINATLAAGTTGIQVQYDEKTDASADNSSRVMWHIAFRELVVGAYVCVAGYGMYSEDVSGRTLCFRIDSIDSTTGHISISVFEDHMPNILLLTSTADDGSNETTVIDMSCLAVPEVPVYQGATSLASGVTGTVPPATSAEKDSFLKGDGTWGALPTNHVTIDTNQTITGVKTFDAGYFGNVEAVAEDQNDPGIYPIDVSEATAFTLTLTEDVEFAFSGVPTGRSACFSLKLDDGGDYTVTWPASVHWCNDTEPELTSGGTDILTFMTFDGGTNWYGTLSMTGITQ